MKPKIEAPWTDDQVSVLNQFQSGRLFHPFTCGGDRTDAAHRAYQAEHGGDFGQLVADKDGWHCPVCDYRQNWAHGFMADRDVIGHLPVFDAKARP